MCRSERASCASRRRRRANNIPHAIRVCDARRRASAPRNGAAARRTPARRRPRAMASAYQKEFVMPEEFPATLRDFTREVLRDQPEDVAKYGYEYCLKKMEEAKAKAEGARRSERGARA